MLDGDLVFVPNDIPRRGVFASWDKGADNPVPGNAKVELVFPGGTYGIRKRLVPAELIPVAEAQVAGQARHPPHRGRLASLAWRLLARPV